MPLTIRTPVGSGIGMAAQHSQSMERYFFGIPGLIVIAPSDPYTAKGLLKSAIRSNNPVIFFEHKLLYAVTGIVPENDYTLPIGKARIVKEGCDVTIVTHLLGVSCAVDAASILKTYGISAEIIDLATLYPIDTDTILESVSKTGVLLVVDEDYRDFGLSGELAARVLEATISFEYNRVCTEQTIPYCREEEDRALPNTARIVEAALKLLK